MQNPGEIIFSFGKHEGATIEEVHLTDPEYLTFIVDTFTDESWIKKKVQEFLGDL